jgi:hypothetical protein
MRMTQLERQWQIGVGRASDAKTCFGGSNAAQGKGPPYQIRLW